MKHILFILFLIHFGYIFTQSGFYYSHITPYSNAPRSLTECEQGFLIAGENSLPDSHANGFLMLLDKQGNIVWEKIILAPQPDEYESYTSAIFNQGYFYVSGFRWLGNQRRNLIMKVNINGNVIWDKVFGDEAVLGGDNDVQDLTLSQEGLLVTVSGYNPDNMSTDAQLIQLDMEANILWSKFYSANNLSTQYSDRMERISPMSDGYLLNMNSLYVPTWQSEYYIIKTDEHGNEIWRKDLSNYQSSTTEENTLLYFKSATSFKSNHVIANFVIVNMTDTTYSENQVLIEFDESGNEIDYRKYEKKPGFFSADLFVNENSEIYITGGQWLEMPLREQLYSAKFNENKELLWENNYGFEDIAEIYFCGTITSDGGVLIGGRNQHFQFGTPYFNSIIVKTNCRGELKWDYENCMSPDLHEVNIFPNPFSDHINIHLPNIQKESKIRVYIHDLAGQLVDNQLFFNSPIIQLNTKKYAMGFYNCTIILNGIVLTNEKIIKVE